MLFRSPESTPRAKGAHPNQVRSIRLGQICPHPHQSSPQPAPNETPLTSHPLDALVVPLLKHLEEPNEQPRGREHEDLEVDRDGWAGPGFAMRRLRERRFGREGRVDLSLEPRNSARRSQQGTHGYRRREWTHFQMMTFSAGTYLALPMPTLQSTLVVLSGVGILMTTLLALSLGEKLALTCTV